MDANVCGKIARFMEDSGEMSLVRDAEAIIVAFSGGADSVFLLSFMSEFLKDKTVCAAHLNHSLRGEESERDNDFSRCFCGERNIPFFEKKCDVASVAAERGLGVEKCARDIRYAFFDECRNMLSERLNIDKCKILVATAHNSDDNLETFIFNVVRGSGIKGASGIPPVRDNVFIRPLLCLSSSFIRTYCEKNKIDYVVDSTNAENDYTRNRIRHNIIPLLREISPFPERCVERLTAALRLDDRYIEEQTELAMGEWEGQNRISRSLLCSMDRVLSSRAVMRIYKEVSDGDLSYQHIESVINAARRAGKFEIHLPGHVTAFIGDEIVFEKVEKVKKAKKAKESGEDGRDGKVGRGERGNYSFELAPGENRFLDFGFIMVLRDKNSAYNSTYNGNKPNVYKYLINILLNNDKILGKLFVRNRRAGDVYLLRGHHRKLRKLMNEKGIPEVERDLYPVVCDSEGIVWVPGFPPRDGAAASGGEPNVAEISFFKEQ